MGRLSEPGTLGELRELDDFTAGVMIFPPRLTTIKERRVSLLFDCPKILRLDDIGALLQSQAREPREVHKWTLKRKPNETDEMFTSQPHLHQNVAHLWTRQI